MSTEIKARYFELIQELAQDCENDCEVRDRHINPRCICGWSDRYTVHGNADQAQDLSLAYFNDHVALDCPEERDEQGNVI